ncbi:MAG: hypothetical protein AB1921_03870 [Thermodesulfobacteriota bacterium]
MEPSLRFSVATDQGERALEDGFADEPLPGADAGDRPPTYGQYLSWLGRCLTGGNLPRLASAAGRALGSPVRAGEIGALDLVAEKHGAWYHPAQVRVHTGQGCAVLCANAALGREASLQALREHEVLGELARTRSQALIPDSFGVLREPFRDEDAAVLLCQYFPGFYEFHLRKDGAAPPRMCLWDTDSGPRSLSPGEEEAVYFESARILAYYYDPATCREIHPWHHAAGDFIFSPGPEQPRLRLITVRGFSPVFTPPEDAGPSGPLLGLLFLLTSTSLRARLDRDNGTGELMAAGPASVPPTVRGFFTGLAQACAEQDTDALARAFGKLCIGIGENGLRGICEAVAGSVRPDSPDAPVLSDLAPEHAQSLAAALSTSAAGAFWG